VPYSFLGVALWQESEVSAVKYIGWKEYAELLRKEDAGYVPYEVDGGYGELFSAIQKRCVLKSYASDNVLGTYS
jgi:hypothetical protein